MFIAKKIKDHSGLEKWYFGDVRFRCQLFKIHLSFQAFLLHCEAER